MTRLLAPLLGLLLSTAAQAQVPPMTSWYWQLDGSINTTRSARIYDIDTEDNTAALISSLKANGHMVVCYFSAGTWESYRSDQALFPASVKGNVVSGWPDERWVDIRTQVVKDIMVKRMDAAEAKGCDGLEPDSIDVYDNKPGFPITKADNEAYANYIAAAAHQRGMVVALKNSTAMVRDLVGAFDFAIVEECFKYKECPAYSPFVSAGKAVLSAEYTTFSQAKCNAAKVLKFSLAFYGLSLNGRKYAPCP